MLLSTRLLTLKIHLDRMILRPGGRGTRRQVPIPTREENPSSEALSHRSFLGESMSCFQDFGVSISSDKPASAVFDQLPNRFVSTRDLPDLRGGGGGVVDGSEGGVEWSGGGGGEGERGRGGGEGEGVERGRDDWVDVGTHGGGLVAGVGTVDIVLGQAGEITPSNMDGSIGRRAGLCTEEVRRWESGIFRGRGEGPGEGHGISMTASCLVIDGELVA